MTPNLSPKVVRILEQAFAKPKYLISIDQWVWSYDGTYWEMPKSTLDLIHDSAGPLNPKHPYQWHPDTGDISVSVEWLRHNGKRVHLQGANNAANQKQV